MDDVSLMYSDHRLMIVKVNTSITSFIVVVGHAEHSQQYEKACSWWPRFKQQLMPYKDQAMVVCIDANAQAPADGNDCFGGHGLVGSSRTTTLMVETLQDLELWAPATWDSHISPGADLGTYCYEEDAPHVRIDYVLAGGGIASSSSGKV